MTWGDKSKVQERRLQYWRRHPLLTGANDSDDEELDDDQELDDDEELDDDGELVMVVMVVMMTVTPPPPS